MISFVFGMTVIEKIEEQIEVRKREGIRPSLVILNTEQERCLFTDDDRIAKETSAESYLMEKYNLELLVTPRETEPDVYGQYLLE